jgi:hypothetical protein
MRISKAAVLAFVAACLASQLVHAQDKKTIEKMLGDGSKKMASAKAEDRETGISYIQGYITCAYKKQYEPLLIKALKDDSQKVRIGAASTLEKLQSKDAVAHLIPLLEDPILEVKEAAARTLGYLGDAAKSAEPALQKALAAAKAQRSSRAEGSMVEALDQIAGKKPSNRYVCP